MPFHPLFQSQYGGKISANNFTVVETAESIERKTGAMISMGALANISRPHSIETAAGYAAPLTGSSPLGLGFSFGDTWRRTGRGAMEFNRPWGQKDTIDTSLGYAFENCFVGKAMRVRTQFTCTGTQNTGPNDQVNDFFDQVSRKLYLNRIFHQAVWLYYAVGLVPVLLSDPDEKNGALSFVDILDPRMVKTQRAYGKTAMWLKADNRMVSAMADPNGTQDPRNKAYYDAMPKHWKRQLVECRSRGVDLIIQLKDGEFLAIENKFNPIDTKMGAWDGAPLQPYFNDCEQYRMLMAGDFAAAFVYKNLIALVSIGDPKAEGEKYIRPDDKVLADLQAAFQNPNSAQWAYVDPTVNVRYITPDHALFGNEKYAKCVGTLKNLLPDPFWSAEGNGAFAAATVQMQEMQEEVNFVNTVFDDEFWTPIHERAAQAQPRIAKKDVRPPKHDRNALQNRKEYLEGMNNLYSNGGLSVPSLMEAHGIDPVTETAKLQAQQDEVKKKTFVPAFEGKQGITAKVKYGIDPKGAASSKPPGKNGRPATGTRPQSESQTGTQPRPGK